MCWYFVIRKSVSMWGMCVCVYACSCVWENEVHRLNRWWLLNSRTCHFKDIITKILEKSWVDMSQKILGENYSCGQEIWIHTSAFACVFVQITLLGVMQLHGGHLGHFSNISCHVMFPDPAAFVIGAKRHFCIVERAQNLVPKCLVCHFLAHYGFRSVKAYQPAFSAVK